MRVELTSNHAYRVADLQCGFEHEIRHEPMYPLQAGEPLRSVVCCHKMLENSGSQPFVNHVENAIPPMQGRAHSRYPRPFYDSLVVLWKIANIRRVLDCGEYVREAVCEEKTMS